MQSIQQPAIGYIAKYVEQGLMNTPSHLREAKGAVLAREANKQAIAAGLRADFSIYIPKAMAAIARHEGI
ncbi:hypothetical protein [Aeromonas sp. sif2433]|uniref:hypothetical protein n=1 Tax=Aeromonas sp. sif2433 TaxID=2854794 RepID=UPI001C46C495|nr:hypothetical protein [Aeromonas sp. sif2433]MBV7413589.1 hypothetical protein [Aeromonas sp. sif2433]